MAKSVRNAMPPAAPTPAPQAAPYIPPQAQSVAQQFGAAPDAPGMGLFLPGAVEAFTGPNANQLMTTQAHHQPGWRAPQNRPNIGGPPPAAAKPSQRALADALTSKERQFLQEDMRRYENDMAGIGAP